MNLTGAWRGGSRDGLAGWRVTFAYIEGFHDFEHDSTVVAPLR